jgi:phage tail-like protein
MRIKFSEDMNQVSAAVGDTTSALFTKNVSGRISYHSAITIGVSTFFNVIQASADSFSSEHLGLFIGSAGAQNSRNNATFTIVEVLNDTMVRVNATLTNEDPADLTKVSGPTVVISPYRLIPPASSDNAITPAFTPIVLEVTAVPQTAIPSYESTAGYVFLHLHDDPTPNVTYQLELVRIADLAGNEIGSTYSFTSWLVQTPPGRSFDVWDSMIPEYNKEQDTTHDLERVIRCIDEVSKVCLDDVDRFGQMLDPFFTPDHILDTLLKHLGNPFAFAYDMSADRKRDLISVLVAMYKKKGTDRGIEDIVGFFLGKTVEVEDWYIPDDTWTLGESELGYDTYLGPSLSFVRYAFYLKHTDALTNEDKDIIRQIVAFVRPAHTHFIGFMQL